MVINKRNDKGKDIEIVRLEEIKQEIDSINIYDREIERVEVRYDIEKALNELEEDQKRVLIMRYGLDGNGTKTLSAIALLLKLSM